MVTAMVSSGTANTQLNRRKPSRLPTIVGIAVATMLLSTAGIKVAISAAMRTSPRRGTITAGRNCCATVWSTRPLPKRGGKLPNFRAYGHRVLRRSGLAAFSGGGRLGLPTAPGAGETRLSPPFRKPVEHGGAMAEFDFCRASIDKIDAAFHDE